MLISIVIPAYNEAHIITDALARIDQALPQSQMAAVDYEIIVCDNNSTDLTAAAARAAGATVVHEPHNQIARARNTGAEAARGTWLLFIDADSYPPPALLDDTMALINGGRHVGGSSTIQLNDGPRWFRANLQGRNLEMRLFRYGVGAFMFCRRDAFRALDGFDTRLYALEEIDFSKRLRAYGRLHNLGFTILHHHPVITSGRKGDLYSKWTMTKSYLLAQFLLVSKKKIKRAGRLPFWYDGRR